MMDVTVQVVCCSAQKKRGVVFCYYSHGDNSQSTQDLK